MNEFVSRAGKKREMQSREILTHPRIKKQREPRNLRTNMPYKFCDWPENPCSNLTARTHFVCGEQDSCSCASHLNSRLFSSLFAHFIVQVEGKKECFLLSSFLLLLLLKSRIGAKTAALKDQLHKGEKLAGREKLPKPKKFWAIFGAAFDDPGGKKKST